MTIAIAVVGALALISGLLAIILADATIKGSGSGYIGVGFFAIGFAMLSWLLVLVLFIFSFCVSAPIAIKVLGGVVLCFPILLPWKICWLSTAVFYILLLAL